MTPLTYRRLAKTTIAPCLLPLFDPQEIISQTDHFTYEFMRVPSTISSIMSAATPSNFNTTQMKNTKQSFDNFIQQVNQWIHWFEQCFDIFHLIIEWLRKYRVHGAVELCFAISNSRSRYPITVLEMKGTTKEISKLLQSIHSLERLCHIFNCFTPCKVIENGINTKVDQQDSKKFIQDSKRRHCNNSFFVDIKEKHQQKHSINARQNVHWYLASENCSYNVNIHFQRIDSSDTDLVIFSSNNVQANKFVLHGQFETLYPGQLIIDCYNSSRNPCTIWYLIKQSDLSGCHLFNGIVDLHYADDLQTKESIEIRDFADKLDNIVFPFIDRLLDGSIELAEMTDLEVVLRGKDIHISNEVQKLFPNRSTNELAQSSKVTLHRREQEINQVCERLQIFQYYSHIPVIVNCIKLFDLVSDSNDNNTIEHLEDLSRRKECLLKDISQEYGMLTKDFQGMNSQHLDLIKTANECSIIIELMKKFDLYTTEGRQRFQELRDNLTLQFQLQERNNLILDSFIITYALCEPFVVKVRTWKEFVRRVVQLSHFDSHSLKHMKSKKNYEKATEF